ncbi:spore germination protein [Paenibacillus sp. J23TS9]|nr:spore germination protein [Paenibacillus sp. J23TS9]GIP25447.1 spore germination protein [Paenibacillus sp. J23TS9]
MNKHENEQNSVEDPSGLAMLMQHGQEKADKKQENKASGEEREREEGKKESANSSEEGDPEESDKLKAQEKKREAEKSDSVEESVIYWQQTDDVQGSLDRTKATLKEVVGLGTSFDIVFREMTLAEQRTGLFFVNGFAKDNIMLEILKRLTYLTADQLSTDALRSFFECYIPHIQVEVDKKLSSTINKVLMGMSALFIEGEHAAIVMDTRTFPVRSPEEPSIERVVRGARDGFTETLLSNVALVRRRLRDPGLKCDLVQVGRRTRTDVCIAYIDDIVDKVQVDSIREKIKGLDIEGLPLADKQLEEAIINKGWHPYPLVRYSERPDLVSAHLLAGRVAVFVDTSPSVMVMPTTFFDLCQHAEENRQTPFMGTYLRWVRFLGIFASMFLLPLWMLFVVNPELKPAVLDFIGPHDHGKIPIIAQFLMVEFGVDLLRLAAVHTPTPLASAMGLIAAILVGDIAVKTGLFVNEVVLYMAVAAIGMFATPSYELGLANRMVRLVLLVAVAIFKVQGFVVGTTLLILLLTMHRSYNSSYLWPFIPFNAKALASVLFRFPLLESKKRPSFNKTRDNTRMAPNPDDTDQS